MKKYTTKSILEAIFIIGLGGVFLSIGIGMFFQDNEYKKDGEIIEVKVSGYQEVTSKNKNGASYTKYLPLVQGVCKGKVFETEYNDPKDTISDIKNGDAYRLYCINKSNGTFIDSTDKVTSHKGTIFFSILGIILIWLGWIFRKSDVTNQSIL